VMALSPSAAIGVNILQLKPLSPQFNSPLCGFNPLLIIFMDLPFSNTSAPNARIIFNAATSSAERDGLCMVVFPPRNKASAQQRCMMLLLPETVMVPEMLPGEMCNVINNREDTPAEFLLRSNWFVHCLSSPTTQNGYFPFRAFYPYATLPKHHLP